jgi:CheY-like chemotaxis protein/anti-sigma regulatory factor (Ser/Thr protein kinase)
MSADAAAGDFLSRMSHELRTPLNSIIGFAQLLQLDDLDDAQRDYVQRILKSGRQLLALIDEILDISRMEAGTLGLSVEPVDLDATIGDALDLIRPMADDRGLTVEAPAPVSEPRYVNADQQRLAQILLNLLSNAVKYNRAGGKIAVAVEERENRLQIDVADTGPGLSPQQVARLFVPFECVGTGSAGESGSGLGLTIAKRLAELMGGTLAVSSEPGVGATFTVELSRAEAPARGEGVPGDVVAGADGRNGDRDSFTVLYVEDNLLNLRLVQEILAMRPQVNLISAMQGRLGLELAAKHRPDLVLLDVHLPDMPGSEVLARVRSDPALTDIPVVVLSADATDNQIQRLLAAGAQAYLTKPLDIPLFLETIDQHLGIGRNRSLVEMPTQSE